jgi:serine/threonine-protein kinase
MAELKGDYDWPAAERDFERAIELDPNWPEAHEFYALDLGACGRFEESIREIDAAERLEPHSTGITLAKGLILQMANRPDESLAVVRRLAADPVGSGLAGDLVAEDYWAKGMPGEALAAVESLPPTLTPHLRVPLLAAAYAHAGQTEKARETLHSYKVQTESAWWYYLVLAHLALRDTNDALTDLELAYKQRYGEMIWLGVDPKLNSLRANPRFHALLRRVQQTKAKG